VFRIGFVVFQVLIVIGFGILAYELLQTPAGLPVATVVDGVQGNVEAAVPSGTEIARAQTKLGSKGFIAYIGCALASEFEGMRASEMSSLAETYGVRFQAYDSTGDAYVQLTLIEQARLAGAQAIILCPLQPSVLDESLTSVRSADIPLILTDRLENSYGGVMVEQDNVQAGLLAGRFVGEKLAEAGNAQPNILILDEPNYSFSDGRVQGFLQGLREHVPNAQIAGRLPGGADSSASHDALAKFLPITPTVDAIFAVTDSGAYGALDALSNSGLSSDEVIIASINGENHARDEISSGRYLRASVEIAREAGSVGALDAAVKLLGGGEVPEILILPSVNLITHDIIDVPLPPQNGSS
jgi:inositol transport system substrate-binding protein